MLKNLRDGAKSGVMKFILFGFMVMAVAGLVLMDVGGFFRGGVSSNVVATVAGQEISARNFDSNVRRILSRQGIDTDMAYRAGFIDQILQSEINNALVLKSVSEQGLDVSDQMVATRINRLIEPFAGNADITPRQALDNILRSQNMGEEEFVHAIRSEMAAELLRRTIAKSMSFGQTEELQALYQYDHEERTIEYILYPFNRIKETTAATDQILKPLYEASKGKHVIPETRSFTIAIIDEADTAQTLEISDDELQARYEDNLSSFQIPERRILQQAIVSTDHMARDIYNAAKKSGDLKQSAEQVSGGNDAYTGEEEFEKLGLPEELANAVFTAKSGTMLEPVQTALGWHIIYVKEILPESTTPFDEVKENLRDEILITQMADQMLETANLLDDKLASGLTLDEALNETSIKTKATQYGPIRADGSTLDNKDGFKEFESDRSHILQTVYELLEGETAPVMELSDGRYAAIEVTGITPASFKPYEEIKPELAKQWEEDQKAAKTVNEVKSDKSELQTSTKTLKDISNNKSLPVKRNTLIRNETAPDSLSENVKQAVFAAQKGELIYAEIQNGFVLAQIIEIKMPPADKISETELTQIKQTLEGSLETEAMNQYLTQLQNKYGIKINRNVLNAMYESPQ